MIEAVKIINERYVVGSDEHIYRLPFTVNGKNYRLRQIKRVHKHYYFIDLVKTHKDDIETTEIKEPYILIKQVNSMK